MRRICPVIYRRITYRCIAYRSITCRWIGLLAIAVLLSGCETFSYYYQAASGQLQLLRARQPVDKLLADEALDVELRQRLQLAQGIRRFASEQLALPDNNSYRYYADLRRSHVVWNVFAAEHYGVEPKRWCFPIAGCVAYRGYFSEQAAQRYANKLQQQGYDTYVGGVAAYSTLGWFDDPLLNTFINRDEVWLAALIFHELAHQQFYLPGDTAFNESFAQTLEQEGVKRWLASQSQSDAKALQNYLRQQQMQDEFVAMILALRDRLDQLYRQPMSDAAKQQGKEALFQQLRQQQYQAFRQRWAYYGGYDRWMRELNNAKLNTLASYHQWVPAFQCLLNQSGQLESFYQRVAELGQLSTDLREQQLQAAAEPCRSDQ